MASRPGTVSGLNACTRLTNTRKLSTYNQVIIDLNVEGDIKQTNKNNINDLPWRCS